MKKLLIVAVLALGAGTGCASTQSSDTITSVGTAGKEMSEKGGDIAKKVGEIGGSLFQALGAIFGIVEGFGKDVSKVIDPVIPDAPAPEPAPEAPAPTTTPNP